MARRLGGRARPGVRGRALPWPRCLSLDVQVCDRCSVYGRVVASTTELRGFVREAVGDVYRYALALTVSPSRAEQLTTSAAVRLARHVDAVGAAPVSTARLTLVVRREVLNTLPHRRHRRGRDRTTAAPPETGVRSSVALAALASLTMEERLALVLRHHDGLLLPDIAAALRRTYAEAEQILNRARASLGSTAEQFDDGTGADPFGRMVRAVPGPPDSLADRVWVTVDAALVPDYAGADDWRAPEDDPLGWEGFAAGPVDEHHVPPAKEARHVGTTLLVGACALGLVLGVAALTAPRGDSVDAAASTTVAVLPSPAPAPPSTLAAVPTSGTALVDRRSRTPAVPDLVIDPRSVTPHAPDHEEPIERPTEPLLVAPNQANIATSVRTRDGTSSVVVRRVETGGAHDVWLIKVEGSVRPSRADAPDLLQTWGVDDGAVVVSLRIAGHPDAQVLVGLRAGGGGTWLRLPDGAEPVVARPDGSVLCVQPAQSGSVLTTYQVLR